MQKAFDLIKERLEEEIDDVIVKDTYSKGKNAGLRKAKIIVNQVAEGYKHATTCYIQSPCEYQNEDIRIDENDGWIPCSERLPESGETVIVSFKDRFLTPANGTCEGWYDSANKMWNLSEYEHSDNVEVIAWRERLAPYQPKGE